MNRPTELQAYRAILNMHREMGSDFDGHDVNTMIYQSVTDAFDGLSIEDKAIIETQIEKLRNRCSRMGIIGALEVLASVAELVGKE